MTTQIEAMKLALAYAQQSGFQIGVNEVVTALREALAEQPAPVQSALDAMWVALAGYQSQADADGHGETWAAMCSEKTSDAADAAAHAAAVAAAYAAAFAADEAAVADAAADAATAYAAKTEKWAQRAIERINKLKENT